MNSKEVTETRQHGFTRYLQSLADREDRASLAALRRGLGKQPGEAAEAFRLVLPHLPPGASRRDEDLYFLIGTLFALHQKSWLGNDDQLGATNLGASFARLRSEVESDSIEKRFVVLLNCHQDDLPVHLRHGVSLLKSKEIPIDWSQLLRDLRGWWHEDRYVQRKWARAFWSEKTTAAEANSTRVA